MNDERHAPRPKVDHIISLALEASEFQRHGVNMPVFRAVCSCEWTSYVASTDEQLALEQGRKHANRLMRWPLTNKTLNLSLTLKSDQLEPQKVREIIRTAVREAHGE